MKNFKTLVVKFWKSWRLTILFIIFLIPVKSSIADWNWVPTGSMLPTIVEGDLIFVNKMAYDLKIPLTTKKITQWSNPSAGDIVVCFSPEDNTRLVKRIIACPGDTIEMRNNIVYINNKALDYSQDQNKSYNKHLDAAEIKSTLIAIENLSNHPHPVMITPAIRAKRNFTPVKIPSDHYFVMGDNRDKSKDSRFFGLVKRDMIVGKAESVIFSINIKDKYQPRLNRFLDKLN